MTPLRTPHSVTPTLPQVPPTRRMLGRPMGRKAGFLMLLSGLFVLGSYAQDAATSEEQTSVPPRGAWALQFQIGSNFRLEPFQGATVSAKKDLSETQAFRFGTTLNASSIKNDRESDAEENRNSQHLSAVAQYLLYTAGETERVGTVRFYFGAGPEVSFSRSSASIDVPNSEGTENEQTSVRWNAGVAGALGAEWTVHRRIGLLAEYGSSIAYSRERLSVSSPPDDERESSLRGFSLGSGGVRFGVAVYL